MSNNMRILVYKEVLKSFENAQYSANIKKIIQHLELKHDKSSGKFHFSLPLKTQHYDIQNTAEKITRSESNNFITSVTLAKNALSFEIDRNAYVKELLDPNSQKTSPSDLNEDSRTIIVEYSSPNIAKPFHVGHLRSTIIGNYISNVNVHLHNNVRRINYLGDWGTQFGFVQLGMNLLEIPRETVKNNPLRVLYDAYVYAYKMAEKDATLATEARAIFHRLESGDSKGFEDWESFRKYTVEDLKLVYSRLGVNFDEYNWESMYSSQKIGAVISRMENLQLLIKDKENRSVIPLENERTVPILKSDGSTLYITRDIAAALDRFDTYHFDDMYYVVDNAQTDHFVALIKILERMEMPWANKLKHVKFGRIRGMSTRKGTAVFLNDILDETKTVMKEKLAQSPTTKISSNLTDQTADILGVSAVIVNDLRQRRQRDYEFDWDRALDIKGDTGVKLQYAHCRLVSLEESSGVQLASECDPSLLKEPIVDQLVAEIGKFDQTLFKSHQELESCILVNYLFGLSNTVNKAMKTLRVKEEASDVGSQRLLLFHTAKNILAQGMRLLGLTPLNKM